MAPARRFPSPLPAPKTPWSKPRANSWQLLIQSVDRPNHNQSLNITFMLKWRLGDRRSRRWLPRRCNNTEMCFFLWHACVVRPAKVVQQLPTLCLNGLHLRENTPSISHQSPNDWLKTETRRGGLRTGQKEEENMRRRRRRCTIV